MSILHTVNKSPFEKSSVASCFAHLKEGSAVLLYEDAVYAAMQGTAIEGLISSAKGVKVYALGPDMQARGVSVDRLIGGVEVIDYAGFVDLAAEHDKVQAWV
jgi:tRNA 2-thiouridine synthesizing protein B